MGLKYCEGCHQLEGDTTRDEESDELLCAHCLEPITNVPEHDDMDMER